MKISYHAYLKRISICEHFLEAIMKTFSKFHLERQVTYWDGDSFEGITEKLKKIITFKSAFSPKLKGIASL
jgi:hypothetical protein